MSLRRSTLKGFRHGDDAVVTPLGAHHGNGNSGVSGSGLDDRVSRFELAFGFGRLDDGKSQSILDGRERVGKFGLGINGYAGSSRHGVAEFHHGGVANHFGNVVEGGTVACSPSLGIKSRYTVDFLGVKKGFGSAGEGGREDCGGVEEIHLDK